MFNLGVKDKNSPLLYIYKTIVCNASTSQPQGRFAEFLCIDTQTHKIIKYSNYVSNWNVIKDGPLTKYLQYVLKLRDEGKFWI